MGKFAVAMLKNKVFKVFKRFIFSQSAGIHIA